MTGYVILAIAAIVVFAFVLQPLLSRQRHSVINVPARIADLNARRQYLMQAIRDVDFDYASGKTADDEYQETRTAYIREAAVVLRDLEKETGGIDEEIEVEILQLRAMARQSQVAQQESASS